MNINKNVFCPKCQFTLKIVETNLPSGYAILRCNCDFYPVVEGIVYMIKPHNKIIVNYLKKGEINKSLTNLISFSLSSKIFFRLTYPVRAWYKKLGFKKLIDLFTLLSLDKNWGKYLKNREKIPSFFLSLLSLDLIKNKESIILDLGCGTGNLIPFYYNCIHPGNLIALDSSFLSLYLAKNYFVHPNTTLICADFNQNLPIMYQSTDNVYMNDSFHYVKKKLNLLKRIYQTLNKKGRLTIIQMLNIHTPKYPESYGSRPNFIIQNLKNLGFKRYVSISNKSLWKGLKQNNRISINLFEDFDYLQPYSVLAANLSLPGELELKKSFLNLFKKTRINFYQDNYLMDIK